MELVMRYFFWVVLVVILALAGGFWFLTVPGVQEESTQLQNAINEQARVLKEKADKKDEILTQSHVDATKAYAVKLDGQDRAVKELLRSKTQTVMDPKFQQAPADPLRFDEWLIGVRKEILDQAQKAGLVLPIGFAALWLDEGKITVKADRDARLEKVAFIGEVVRLLCEVRGQVTELEFAKADQVEVPKQVSVGVYSLDGIDRLDEVKADAREREYLAHAFGSTSKAPPALKKLPSRPYKTVLIDIRFTAPLSVVPQVVQTFEASPKWFGIVRKIDCQRVVEPYAKTATPATVSAVEIGADGRPMFSNSRYHEAPVQVQFWLEILKMDEQALK